MRPLAESSTQFWPSKTINTGPRTLTNSSLYPLTATSFLFTNLLLLPAALICLPRPRTLNEQFTFTGIVHAVQSCITVSAVYILTVLGCIPQVRSTWLSRHQTQESVLSTVTLALHVVAFLWLAIARFSRLRPLPEQDMRRDPGFPACHEWECYAGFGWSWFSPILDGVGRGVSLGICLYGWYMESNGEGLRSGGDEGEAEREALLQQQGE